jgi:phasin
MAVGYEELTMAKEPFEQFAMPNEVRAFVEQSVAQARVAFDGIANAANHAVSQWQGQAQAARAGASEIAHKSMAYAEQNMATTFEFAEKLMHVKDPGDVLRLQSEYVARQMQSLSSQAQELGQSAAKIVMDAAKPRR